MSDAEEFQGEPLCFEERGAVLHRLNRDAINNKGQRKRLLVEDFQKTVKEWPGVPIIFAQEHPTSPASKNLAKALAEVNGKLLGAIKDASVITDGSPRLVANLGELVSDKAFKAADKAGRLELSPAWFPSNEGPHPDHLLIFEGDATHQPGDKGAMMFQNLTDEAQGFFSELFQKIKNGGSISREAEKMADDVEKLKTQNEAFQNTLKQKEADLLAFQEQTKAKDAELVKAKKELEEFQAKALKAKQDVAYNAFQSHVPKGWITGKVKLGDKEVEKAEVLRQEFEADPTAVAMRLVKFNEEHPGSDGTDEGQDHDNAGAAAPDPNAGYEWDPFANGGKGGFKDAK